jgi:hypothetical protein
MKRVWRCCEKMPRPLVENFKGSALDACHLRRLGLLDGRRHSIDAGLKWPKLSTVTVDPSCIVITLRNSSRQQVIPISWAKCFTNSARPWLVCPQCNKRYARLFCGFDGYQCRWCCDMIYGCQSVSSRKRMKTRLKLIYRRLGYHQIPESVKRPKGMWRRTYSALQRSATDITVKLTLGPRAWTHKLAANVPLLG